MYKLSAYTDFLRNRITYVNNVINLRHIHLKQVMKSTSCRL